MKQVSIKDVLLQILCFVIGLSVDPVTLLRVVLIYAGNGNHFERTTIFPEKMEHRKLRYGNQKFEDTQVYA